MADTIQEIDYPLLKACLASEPGGWENFVDRFLGLVLHTIDHTAQSARIALTREERSDICEEVFRALCYRDKILLRNFTYSSSVSTYLAVVVRRLVLAFFAKIAE